MANKDIIASNDITLFDGKNFTTSKYEISQTFNKHYINIIKKVAETSLIKWVLH